MMNHDLEADADLEAAPTPWPIDSARGQILLMTFGGVCGLALAMFAPHLLAAVVGFSVLAAVRLSRRALKWEPLEGPDLQWDTMSVDEIVMAVRQIDRERRRIVIQLLIYAARLAVLVWVMGALIAWTAYFAVTTGIPWLAYVILSGVVGFTFGFVRSILTRGRVERPPLCRTARALEWVLPQRVYARCVGPLLGDSQKEYFDTLGHGQKWRARWLVVVFYIALGSQLAALSIRGVARLLIPRRREDW